MAQEFRKCKGQDEFNTGRSKCLLNPGKIKGIVLAPRGFKFPKKATVEELEKLCHADRPYRIYPIKTVDEFAPSGGEANVTSVGYGGSAVSGYSAFTAALTLDQYDATLKTNLMRTKGMEFDAWMIDEDNVVFGTEGDKDGLGGIELSGVYPSGQDWDSSGTEASLVVNLMFKDYEKYIKTAAVKEYDFDVLDALKGLVFVDLVKVEESKYKIIEHFGGLDVTGFYAEALKTNATTVFDGEVSAIAVDGDVLTITATGTPSLKKPSVLQANGISGIEQFSTYSIVS